MITAEVLEARARATALLRWESRGPGDTDNAMRRVATRHGLDYGALWALRYRTPKRIWADVATAISAAYEAERQRQIRKLAHDIEITEALAAGTASRAVEQARAVLRQAEKSAAEVAEAQAAHLTEPARVRGRR